MEKVQTNFYPQRKQSIGDINRNGQIITEDWEKAETFYQDVFQGNHLNTNNFDEYLKKAVETAMIDNDTDTQFPELSSHITADALTAALKAMKTSGKGADKEGVHPNMLKTAGYQFHINLMVLFNKIVDTGKWPFSQGNSVIFLRKPGKKNYSLTANYRPITISSVVGKLFERVLEIRLRQTAESNKWIPNYQHGFRKGRSTHTYLAQMITTIEHNKAHKRNVAGIFVDLQKAFDSVWHDGMLFRLKQLGISGSFLNIISNFLKERKIVITVNTHKSPPKPCAVGLPQGSVLSPLLFVLYTRDLLDNMQGLPLQYADDCSIVSSAAQHHDLVLDMQSNCRQLSSWLARWRMGANCSKTDVLWFSGPTAPLMINGERLTTSKYTTVLGLHLDARMTFKTQIEKAKGSLSNKWTLLTPFINSGLSPICSKRILTTVLIPQACHYSYIWDTSNSFSIYKYMKDVIGAQFNPPAIALHNLLHINSATSRNTKLTLTLCRHAIKDGVLQYILSQNKSKLQKTIKLSITRLVGRNFVLSKLDVAAFRKANLKQLVEKDNARQWRSTLRSGACATGLLPELEPAFIQKNPIPLTNKTDTKILCGVLTGHIPLQTHLFNLGLSFTPTCTCLKEDETVHHYIYNCPNYAQLRKNTQPSPTNYNSLIDFVRLSYRF